MKLNRYARFESKLPSLSWEIRKSFRSQPLFYDGLLRISALLGSKEILWFFITFLTMKEGTTSVQVMHRRRNYELR